MQGSNHFFPVAHHRKEHSQAVPILKEHYAHIIVHSIFEKSLKDMGGICQKTKRAQESSSEALWR